MKFVVHIDGRKKTVLITRENSLYQVEIDGRCVAVDCRRFGDGATLSLLIDNKSYLIETAPVEAERGSYYARVMGRHYVLEVLDELSAAARAAERGPRHTGSYTLRAPMPGLVVAVQVKPGDRVRAGDAVVIMEAMKMRNELVSEVAGVVKEIAVDPGQKVDSQAPLVRIERE